VKANIVGGVLGLLTVVSAAAAQPQGDPTAGHELAAQFCASCHIIGAERVGSDVAPPFRAIAADPDKSFTELHAWRGPMHPAISNLALSPRQIADINAYLDSLHPAAEPAAAPPAASKQPPPAIENAPAEKLGEPIKPRTE
jgi:mono/diheme cytochrome c family protein